MPSQQLEWHGHNDFHKVHVNGVTAWHYGVSALNTTLVGFGERTGNPPMEGALMEFIGLKGRTCGIETTVITEIANYYRDVIHADIPDNYPFVGKECNTTRAGIHADGILKNPEIYNIFDTKKILNRPAGVLITKTSGLAGIAYWINEHYRLKGDKIVDKRSPVVVAIKEWVDKEYENERQNSISDRELEALIAKFNKEGSL